MILIDRNYILNMAKSRDMTIDEFNYDKLVAPPISYYFSPYDIQRLYEIASSLRYSAKPQVKYQEIDKIMRSRGFVKLSAGTNRVVYKCLNDDTFVAKVAYDSVALNDNPREFLNQNYLKPFCAKTFEVTPNGVLAFAERVNPITNREEFLSVAEAIFTLITEFIIGEYVMDDIGTHYFMNYGMRRGFGPVLVDTPYCYRLDGNKLFCNKPDNNRPEGKCLGEIDYDAGYNHLVCKRCGKIYKAKDLELKVKENNIVTKSIKGAFNKMKVSISGGSKNYDVTTDVTETTVIDTEVKSEETVYAEKKNSVHVSLGNRKKEEVDTPKVMKVSLTSKVEIPAEVNEVKEEPVAVEEKKEEELSPVVEETPVVVQEEVKEEKKPTCPITMGGEEKTNKDYIRDDFNDVAKRISAAHMNGSINEELISQVISGIKFVIGTMRSSGLSSNNEHDLFDIILSAYTTEHKVEIKEDEVVSSFGINVKNIDGETVTIYESIYTDPVSVVKTPEEAEVAEENTEEPAEELPVIEDFTIDDDQAVGEEDDAYEFEEFETPKITGFETFKAQVIDIATKIPNTDHKKVIVVDDGYGSLLTVNNGTTLFVIDNIDNLDTDNVTILSKVALSNVMSEVDDKSIEISKEALENLTTTEKVSTVNGVPTEEE